MRGTRGWSAAAPSAHAASASAPRRGARRLGGDGEHVRAALGAGPADGRVGGGGGGGGGAPSTMCTLAPPTQTKTPARRGAWRAPPTARRSGTKKGVPSNTTFELSPVVGGGD